MSPGGRNESPEKKRGEITSYRRTSIVFFVFFCWVCGFLFVLVGLQRDFLSSEGRKTAKGQERQRKLDRLKVGGGRRGRTKHGGSGHA